MKSAEKFIDEIIALFKNNDLIGNATKTPNGFILKQKNENWLSILFLCICILVPAMVLLYSDLNTESFIVSLLWVVSMGYTFYKAITAENIVEFDLTKRTIKIENINLLLKHIIRTPTIEFNDIESIQIKLMRYSSYGTSSSRLILKTKYNKSYVLNEYLSGFVARKLKFAITSLVAENKKNHLIQFNFNSPESCNS